MLKGPVHAAFKVYTPALLCTGIGAAICQRLVQEGAKVLVADIDGDAAAATCKSVQMGTCMSCQVPQILPCRTLDRGVKTGNHKLAQVDVSDEKQVQDLVARVVHWAGRLDIWVNNAAKFVFGAATTATDAGKSGMQCHQKKNTKVFAFRRVYEGSI